MRPWRLIVDEGPAQGSWNMAVDRAIQVACAAGDVAPTLRLYTWARPTVTLGRFQDPSGVDTDRCRALGVDIVRRFTGGRGVLHDDEVTYSVVASVADGVPRGTAASYRYLCGPLVEAYRRLGLAETSLTRRERGAASAQACYLHATAADLSLGVRKLSGSAQVWMGDVVLQHGSFTVTRDIARESAVFRLDPEHASALADTTLTIADVCEPPPSRDAIVRTVIEAFEAVFGITVEKGDLTADETRTARELLDEVVLEDGSITLDIDRR